MPQFYQVLKADPIGDPFTPNQPGAKPLQSYWCQVKDVEEAVMITKQIPNTPSLTEGHYGVLEQRTSKKGNPYWKFTSMQIPQGESKPRYAADSAPVQQAPSGVSAGMFHVLEQRVSNLEALLATPKQDEPKVEAPVDKAKLEEIFGEEIDDPIELPPRGDGDKYEP